MNNVLEMNRVDRVYRSGSERVFALKGITTRFEQGEFTALVGPSGAGKSTLMHVAGGLEPPTKGNVRYNGEDIYRMSDRRVARWRNVTMGFVFQFYHLVEELTVRENVALPYFLFSRNRKTAFKKAEEVLQYFDIDGKKSSFPSELSGGQKQKVALARALINDPEIVFCDEPTGNLDTVSAEKVIDFLSLLNREKKKTVIIVTHNPDIARRAGRVLKMSDGMIAA